MARRPVGVAAGGRGGSRHCLEPRPPSASMDLVLRAVLRLQLRRDGAGAAQAIGSCLIAAPGTPPEDRTLQAEAPSLSPAGTWRDWRPGRPLPMAANSVALIAAKVFSLGLGFLSWLVAARLF